MAILKFAGIFLLAALLFCSCASYKQNIMFKLPKGEHLQQQLQKAEENYVIQKNDLVELEVFTNKGEKIIDPALDASQSSQQTADNRAVRSYLVTQAGVVRFPLIDEINLEGLTLRQAEGELERAYGTYYQQPFVRLKFANKRVVLLGGKESEVIPLTNENMRLTEVLALSNTVGNDSKVGNIRILREQQVYVADLTTIAGYQKDNIIMQPNDIVYVEPVRRPFIEALRDYGPVLTLVTSITTLIVLITQTDNNSNN